ncbi:MAG TPA: N-acetylmuramoyl-L-alanine amidase [Candidatus Paceibacterota bacterium]
MKTTLVIISLAVLEFTVSAEEKSDSTATKELAGVLVIIDPGHGGADPGTNIKLKDGKKLCESAQVYDVACRLRLLLLAKGATVKMTIVDPKTGFKSSDDAVLDQNKGAVFNDTKNDIVFAKEKGLTRRLEIAKVAANLHKEARVVYVSIHFDSTSKGVAGPHVVSPPSPGSDVLAQAIAKALRENGRNRTSGNEKIGMVIRSGDMKNHGMPNLYILRSDKNPIKNRALVELGNIRNLADVWRIRDWKIRQIYAEAVASGIILITSEKK